MVSADLPRDGRGGYLYESNLISFPTYINTTMYTSFSTIDSQLETGAGGATTFAVTFGACLMTLIHVLAFTTPDKRGRSIFNCIVVGLLLEVIRLFCAIWAVTRSGTNTSYFLLTDPWNYPNATDAEYAAATAANAFTNFSLGTKVNAVIDGCAAVLAFLIMQYCFYILVHAMMSAMRRRTVRIVLIVLVGVGAHAAIWRFVEFIWNNLTLFSQTFNFGAPDLVISASQISTTISICAWCVVYGFLVLRSAVARIRLGIEFKRGEARHVMFMTALESMIVPLLFIVLQWLAPSWFPEPEYCVVPSILILLPFGTLWATSFDPNEAHRGHVGRYLPRDNQSATLPRSSSNPIASNATSTDSPSQPLVSRKATKLSGLRTFRSNPNPDSDPDAVKPAPAAHPFEDPYFDGDSEGTIRIRRPSTTRKARRPITSFDGIDQV